MAGQTVLHGERWNNYQRTNFPRHFHLLSFYLQICSIIVTILILQCSAHSSSKSSSSSNGAMDRLQLWPGTILRSPSPRQLQPCNGGKGLKYISGDALADGTNCVGPNNQPYPKWVIPFIYLYVAVVACSPLDLIIQFWSPSPPPQGTHLEDVLEAGIRIATGTHGLIVPGDHGSCCGPICLAEGLRTGEWRSPEQPIWWACLSVYLLPIQFGL